MVQGLSEGRAVSHYNNIKTVRRTSLKQETINGMMHVSLNGKGTALYDRRPAVFEFLRKKERRNRQPSDELYKNRDLLKSFFKLRMALFSTYCFS